SVLYDSDVLHLFGEDMLEKSERIDSNGKGIEYLVKVRLDGKTSQVHLSPNGKLTLHDLRTAVSGASGLTYQCAFGLTFEAKVGSDPNAMEVTTVVHFDEINKCFDAPETGWNHTFDIVPHPTDVPDEAQRRAEGIEEEDSLKEAKKLKPGDVDPTPETKPARPDPIDMDEDELEMLSEARARLANTQGKKAKRKAREKQLGEARRLASLQKRRELRAAGIIIGSGWAYKMKKHRLMDYNNEIPFEKQVPAGFHDPSEDKFDKAQKTMVEEKRRDWQERDDRKADKDKLKKRKNEDLPESIFGEKHEKKRSKLILPEPQISDKELEDIIKIGHVSDSVRELVDDNPSSTLLHDYNESARMNAFSARTQRAAVGDVDTVARAADDLLALINVETPLKGGLNTPLHNHDFSAPGSQRQPISTPNTVLSAMAATPKNVGVGQTPGSQRTLASSTPGGASTTTTEMNTPFRDQLNINPISDETRPSKKELQQQFYQLPKPKNDFELTEVGDEYDDFSGEGGMREEWIEDAAELEKRRQAIAEKKKALELEKRTRAFQRQLPLPSKLNIEYKKRGAGGTDLHKTIEKKRENMYNSEKADDLIKSEVYSLMEWDVEGKEPPPKQIYSKEAMELAKKMIDIEATKMAEAEDIELKLDSQMWQVVANCFGELVKFQNRFTRLSNLSKRDQLEVLSERFKVLFGWMTSQATKMQKLEKKVRLKLGGYMNIESSLTDKLQELAKQRETALLELKTFKRLEQNEQKAIVKRISSLTAELKEQEIREKNLQKRFSFLQHRKWELEQLEKRENATSGQEPIRYASFENVGHS
uniref:Pre-mRNA splicing factor component Cdc5p/Cef1 C-terminal domain-containing protein n=1 Tax=Meloidogyne javanica TaxID=6303 RepID=A0A915LLT7_MELJA